MSQNDPYGAPQGQPPQPQQPAQPPQYQPAPQQPAQPQQPPAPAQPQLPVQPQPPYAQPAPGAPSGYPDPTVPPVYPASPIGDQQPVGHPGPYAGYGAPSAFAGPPQPPHQNSSGAGGLAIAALIVGIGAFVFAWVPIFGILVAVVGLVLGILAIRKRTGRGLSITGTILSGLGLLGGIIATLFILVLIPMWATSAAEGLADDVQDIIEDSTIDEGDEPSFSDADEYATVDGQLIDTPCWSYEGPVYFTNNISSDAVAACNGKLELWGEEGADGVVVPTGVGTVYGQVGVEPVRISTAESYAPGTDPAAVVDALADSYFGQQGEIVSLHESATLGGVPAEITRVDSDADLTQTKAFITAYAPAPYDNGGDEQVQLFIISIVTPYDNGDELIQQVLNSWQWQ